MQLPNVHRARIEQEKITTYLLCEDHPDGQSKAEFFRRFGFRMASWQILAEALRNQAARHAVSEIVESSYGTRYVIDGPVEAPDGRAPTIRTVWIVEEGTDIPRLITAYPA